MAVPGGPEARCAVRLGPQADELRDRLDELLTEATGTLADLRIAARRGELAELPKLATPLTEVADGLHAFAEDHA